ncbi:MAG: nucleotide pyrophosphohydrolase [Lachnospiraceae bacterium]|nr:nucleotide pyrophosphohydrolase [Lachnospiraceae bacterium]
MTQETVRQILKFRDDRDWKQFHNPKDLAISISLEAAELLEVFQWTGADTSSDTKIEKIKEELADVINYCVLMADVCGLDIDEIVQEKIKRNAEKYPVEKAKGKSDKYNKL